MNKSRDIEYEMSRFEAEITKLTPATTIISAPPVNNFTIKTNMVEVNSVPSVAMGHQPFRMMIPTSFSGFSFQTPQIPAPATAYIPPIQTAYIKPSVPLIPKVIADHASSSAQSSSSGVKRDSSGTAKSIPTTAAAAATAVAAASFETDKKKAKDAKEKKNKSKKFIRAAGGQTWEDDTLVEWDPEDFRLFCGDLGNEVTDESLTRAFQKYPSFQKAKVIRDKRTSKTKGYGFVSFKDSGDFIKAMREMDGKYVGNRPIKLRKSNWQDRNLDNVRRKETEKQKMGLR